MRITKLFLLIFIPFIFLESCATSPQIPTLNFIQYGLEPGPNQSQTKSDIDINLKAIRISEIYQYPDLFSFNLDDYPQYKGNIGLSLMYPKGPVGKQWEYPFATPDLTEQLLLCWVKIQNNTKHILRMKDARIYLIVEGQEPAAALSTFDELLRQTDYFQQATNRYLARQGSLIKLEVPPGFYRSLLLSHKNYYRLINDLNKEILPGFTYEGLLVFPVVPTSYASAKISFFDITTKTDAAGVPIEKTQFDFMLKPQNVQAWYDRKEHMWKGGTPPVQQ